MENIMDNSNQIEFEDIIEGFVPQDINYELAEMDHIDLIQAIDSFLEYHTSSELLEIVNEYVG
jgi:hypothetical protein